MDNPTPTPHPVIACPWCPGFDRFDPRHWGASHGPCARCTALLHAQMDAKERKA